MKAIILPGVYMREERSSLLLGKIKLRMPENKVLRKLFERKRMK